MDDGGVGRLRSGRFRCSGFCSQETRRRRACTNGEVPRSGLGGTGLAELGATLHSRLGGLPEEMGAGSESRGDSKTASE